MIGPQQHVAIDNHSYNMFLGPLHPYIFYVSWNFSCLMQQQSCAKTFIAQWWCVREIRRLHLRLLFLLLFLKKYLLHVKNLYCFDSMICALLSFKYTVYKNLGHFETIDQIRAGRWGVT